MTEYAALAAARWSGRGDKEAADQAAVDAMRLMLGNIRMAGAGSALIFPDNSVVHSRAELLALQRC